MSRRIVIVGGGIAGLAAAHRLLELRNAQALDLEILLLEASASPRRLHRDGASRRFSHRGRTGFVYL